MTDKQTKRKTSLVFDIDTEKVYYAVLTLQHHLGLSWVAIEMVALLLREEQRRCVASGGKKHVVFALWPPELYPNGWDDHRVVRELARLSEKRLLLVQRRPEGNFFQCVPPGEHGLYELRHPEKVAAILQTAASPNKLSITEP